jgi:hypothetical protein
MGPKIISRKDAKGAKFGEIKARAAKKKMVGWSGAFASLASWREKNSEEVSPAKAPRSLSLEK